MVIWPCTCYFQVIPTCNKISDLDLQMKKLTCGYDFILSLSGLEFVLHFYLQLNFEHYRHII
jgi:hypothetical protein